MNLFTKKFLDELQEEYKEIPDVLDNMMDSGLSYEDSIVMLAKSKDIKIEYFKNHEYE
jgi:hypothetical protein